MDPLIDQAKKDIALTGVTNMTQFIDPIILDKVCEEAHTAFRLYGKRKDFISVNGGGTPRNMFTVSKANIDVTGNEISKLYRNPELLRILCEIAGETVSPIHYEKEKYVINVLAHGGDTHGWHFDDYSWALVVIVKTPPQGGGGYLQYVPNSNDGSHRADFSKMESILKNGPIHTTCYPSKTVYLMRSLMTLHRVSPVELGHDRMSIALSYGIESDWEVEGSSITDAHKNIEDLYG